MNKSRRQLLRDVVSLMSKLQDMENNDYTLELLRQAEDDLECATDEEQDAYDNLPENLMWSMKADTLMDNLDNLYDALADIGLVVEAYELEDDNPYLHVKSEINSVISNCTKAIER